MSRISTGKIPPEDDDPLEQFRLRRVAEATSRYRRPLRMFSLLFPLFMCVVALIVAVANLPTNPEHRRIITEQDQLEKTSVRLQIETKALRDSFDGLEKRFRSAPSEQLSAAVMEKHLSSLDFRIRGIEDAISENPTRAISLPLMRKDIEALQDRYKTDIASLREETDHFYTLVEWLIGLVCTVIIALASFAAANFRRERVSLRSADTTGLESGMS